MDLKPYVSIFDKLYIENHAIFHAQRMLVSTKQCARLLDKLHTTHIGVVVMKKSSKNAVFLATDE